MTKRNNKRDSDLLNDDQRIVRAKSTTVNLVNHTVNLVMIHEANAIVLYSDQLSSQIPHSYAANAFNQFRNSLHLFEIIRLCAIWDNYGNNRESIPTVADLINGDGILDKILNNSYNDSLNEKPPESLDLSNESVKSWWHKDRSKFAQEVKERNREKLKKITSTISDITISKELKNLQAFRDKFIAHNLLFREDSDDKILPTDISMHRYEDKLLIDTIKILKDLHSILNTTSFDWKGSINIGKIRAEELWNGCSFEILDRPVAQSILKRE